VATKHLYIGPIVIIRVIGCMARGQIFKKLTPGAPPPQYTTSLLSESNTTCFTILIVYQQSVLSSDRPIGGESKCSKKSKGSRRITY